jgi:hypothetical protein
MRDIVAVAALRALAAALIVCVMGSTVSAQGLPAPWAAVDIGTPGSTGTTTHAAGLFALDAGGNDIAGSSDQFHFLHQPIAGDVEIVARLEGLTATHPWTIAGLMVRASLAANASHAFVAVTPDKGVLFRSRASSGANTSQLTGPALKPPAWFGRALSSERSPRTAVRRGCPSGRPRSALGTRCTSAWPRRAVTRATERRQLRRT